MGSWWLWCGKGEVGACRVEGSLTLPPAFFFVILPFPGARISGLPWTATPRRALAASGLRDQCRTWREGKRATAAGGVDTKGPKKKVTAQLRTHNPRLTCHAGTIRRPPLHPLSLPRARRSERRGAKQIPARHGSLRARR